MTEITIQQPHAVDPDVGYVGKIPIRNIWLLMLYASDAFRYNKNAMKSVEENPDEIPDLIAEILAARVRERLFRNLTHGYRRRNADLRRVRGHIDMLRTEAHQLLDRGMVACRFDELTVNTPRNRYVRAALDAISNIVGNKELAHKCRSLSSTLLQMGVIGPKPSLRNSAVDRFGRHDLDDVPMVTAAKLAFDLALPNESDGSKPLPLPCRDEVFLRALFEKAIGGFYKVVLEAKGWKVNPGKKMEWPAEYSSEGLHDILPVMITDIILDNIERNKRILIDTKFTSVTTSSQYKTQVLKTGYMYQLYTYLRTQEESQDDPLWKNATGILLHPCVDEMVNEHMIVQGHKMRFCTVNLAGFASLIRKQLISIVDEYRLVL